MSEFCCQLSWLAHFPLSFLSFFRSFLRNYFGHSSGNEKISIYSVPTSIETEMSIDWLFVSMFFSVSQFLLIYWELFRLLFRGSMFQSVDGRHREIHDWKTTTTFHVRIDNFSRIRLFWIFRLAVEIWLLIENVEFDWINQPYFRYVCQPNVGFMECPPDHKYITEFTCKGDVTLTAKGNIFLMLLNYC